MARETKFGLLFVLVLTSAFGLLVYKRLHQPLPLMAEAETELGSEDTGDSLAASPTDATPLLLAQNDTATASGKEPNPFGEASFAPGAAKAPKDVIPHRPTSPGNHPTTTTVAAAGDPFDAIPVARTSPAPQQPALPTDLDSDPFGSPAVGTPGKPEQTTPALQAGATPARPALPTNLDDDQFFTGALPAGGKPATTTAPALMEAKPASDFPADSGPTSLAASDVPAAQPAQTAAVEPDPFGFGTPASEPVPAQPATTATTQEAFDPFADPVPGSGSPAQASPAPAMTAAANEAPAGFDNSREATEDPFGGPNGSQPKPAATEDNAARSLEPETRAAAAMTTVESENDPFADVQPARPAMSAPAAAPAGTASMQSAEFDPFGDPAPATARPAPVETNGDIASVPADQPAEVEADPFAPPIESPAMSATPAMNANSGAAQPEPGFDPAPRSTPLPTSLDDSPEFSRTPVPAQPAPTAEADPFGDPAGSAAPATPAAPAMTGSAQPAASRSSSIPHDLTPEELGGFRPVPVEELESSRPAINGRDPVAVAVDPFDTSSSGSGARALTSVPAATGMGGERYTVQPTDSFWTISKRVYGTGRYFQALAKHNVAIVSNPQHLKPGLEVMTPSAGELERLYRADIPLADAASVKSLRSDHPDRYQPDQEPGFFLDAQGQPMYRVGSNDTLSQISQNHLGRSSRWIQIFQMNRDILKDGNTLSVGTVLKLPPDASQVQTIGYEAPDR